MKFYLGTHEAQWVSRRELAGVPLFISHERFTRNGERVSRYPAALTDWGQDSNGYFHLRKHGRWTFTPEQYAASTRRRMVELGRMDFASQMDWMCESDALSATGRTWQEHVRLTVENAVHLRRIAPDIPWMFVIQGVPEIYGSHEMCVRMFADSGIDLTREPHVGIGSVCRLQGTQMITDLFSRMRDIGIVNPHGFGVKTLGVKRIEDCDIGSSDSLAWSTNGRRRGYVDRYGNDGRALPSCRHKTCANCIPWALRWLERFLLQNPNVTTPSVEFVHARRVELGYTDNETE